MVPIKLITECFLNKIQSITFNIGGFILLIPKQKNMTESEKIAVDNSNNQYLQALSYVAVGTIYPYAGQTPPETFMFCDGTELDIDEYAELFGVIGYKFGGSGDKFNLPTKNMLPNSSLNYIIKTMQDDISGKVVLKKGTEVVFLGGDARSSVQVELAIDDEPSPNSDNLVKSSGVFKEANKHNKQIEAIADYIVEQGIKDGWIYEICKSGVAKCSRSLIMTNKNSGSNTEAILLPIYFSDFIVNATPSQNGSLITKYGDYNGSANKQHGNGYFYFTYEITGAYDPGFNFFIVGTRM